MVKWIFLFGLVFCMHPLNAQTTTLKSNIDDNTLLWEISGNGLAKPSFLFGTFHLLCKDDINFSAAFRKAVAGIDEVYLELDMDDPAILLQGIMLMSMKDGKKLKDLYTAEQYKRVSDYFRDSLKISLGLFGSMKPEFLMALLYPKLMPCSTVSSVEEEIMLLAKKDAKAINGLETMAMQAAVFDSIPYQTQATELLKAIDSMETSKTNFTLMLHAYLNQDLDGLENIILSPEFGGELNQDILLDKRNKNWVEQLKEIMKKKSVFVAVSAGHLVGKKGLIALLRKEGYTVRGVENKK